MLEGKLLHPEDGSVKMLLLRRALKVRNEMPDLFSHGEYTPLYAEGDLAHHIIAFARKHHDRKAVVIAPRFFASLTDPSHPPVGHEVWADTTLRLPDGFAGTWGETVSGGEVPLEPTLKIADVLTDFPVALLVSGLDPVQDPRT
jgi:(1->4)-alpha-D-glucan 1-alpha-D-glucosylmutase